MWACLPTPSCARRQDYLHEVGKEQLSRSVAELLSESYFILGLLLGEMYLPEQHPFGRFSDERCDLAQRSSCW